MLLVPATMTLLGRHNWSAPGPLRRLHHLFGAAEDQSVRTAGRLTSPAEQVKKTAVL
ncbi:hypothetical protein ACFP2T_10565 [Plantactinospora solaniradicis]|uniref:Uncharacterized protein n=1 Tax=Plantactinospora solaniradicis TaxID=1723736 RepID=A0ABW1K8M6_9ACTN